MYIMVSPRSKFAEYTRKRLGRNDLAIKKEVQESGDKENRI
ncbi:hypothetical protein SCACP_36940 [Sporomusa carbonis]